MAYRPARAPLDPRRSGLWSLRDLRRMEPNAVYYLVTGGGALLVGIVVDALGPVRWWVVTGLGLAGAWAFTWLTALDDVRHPWRSLRILAAVVADPWESTRIRAVAYDLPLYAPPSDRAGTRRLTGVGLTYPAGLLAPVRPSATVTWSDDDAQLQVRTAMESSDTDRPGGGLPSGIAHHLVELEDEPGLGGVTGDALVGELRPVTFDVDGRPLDGTLLDLTARGLGWLAEARVSPRFRIELAGDGVPPDGLVLAAVGADDLPDPSR